MSTHTLLEEGFYEEFVHNPDKFQQLGQHPVYNQPAGQEEATSHSRQNSNASEGTTIYCEPPLIHMLKRGDTIKSISKKYNTTEKLISTCNGNIEEIDEQILSKRKFVVIPSVSTFNGNYIDMEYCLEVGPYEQQELCRNFCLFFNIQRLDVAEHYLRKEDYNLAAAVESYQFEIC
ncbi:hypothetical protein EDD86DRAFT_199106 [Gorgonomyces haynaldii]|nr:hypothetical protein EDD86DRAFT_199106 [Gorgonomyces haynaldii]